MAIPTNWHFHSHVTPMERTVGYKPTGALDAGQCNFRSTWRFSNNRSKVIPGSAPASVIGDLEPEGDPSQNVQRGLRIKPNKLLSTALKHVTIAPSVALVQLAEHVTGRDVDVDVRNAKYRCQPNVQTQIVHHVSIQCVRRSLFQWLARIGSSFRSRRSGPG